MSLCNANRTVNRIATRRTTNLVRQKPSFGSHRNRFRCDMSDDSRVDTTASCFQYIVPKRALSATESKSAANAPPPHKPQNWCFASLQQPPRHDRVVELSTPRYCPLCGLPHFLFIRPWRRAFGVARNALVAPARWRKLVGAPSTPRRQRGQEVATADPKAIKRCVNDRACDLDFAAFRSANVNGSEVK